MHAPAYHSLRKVGSVTRFSMYPLGSGLGSLTPAVRIAVEYCSIEIQPRPAGSNVRKSASAFFSFSSVGTAASAFSRMACSPEMYSARKARGSADGSSRAATGWCGEVLVVTACAGRR